jgi:hypothetical protein
MLMTNCIGSKTTFLATLLNWFLRPLATLQTVSDPFSPFPLITEGVRFYPQHRTVPCPTVFHYNFCHARVLLARDIPFFLPKVLRFSAKKGKKVKSANLTVLKIETVLAF